MSTDHFLYKRMEPERTDLHRLVRTWYPSIPGMLTERFGPRAKLAKFQTQSVARWRRARKVLILIVFGRALTAPD